MDILDQLQILDDLIIEHTKPPITAILRNKLHTTREQAEAYASTAEELDKLKVQNATLIAENTKLKAPASGRWGSKPPFKGRMDP